MNQQYNKGVGSVQATTHHAFTIGQHESPKSIIISCEKIVLRDNVIEVDVDITNGIEKVNKIVINGLPFYRIYDPDAEQTVKPVSEQINPKYSTLRPDVYPLQGQANSITTVVTDDDMILPRRAINIPTTKIDADDNLDKLTIVKGDDNSSCDTYVIAKGDTE